MTRITIARLNKRFDKQTVLQDLDLVIEVGSARIHVDSALDESLLRRVVRALGGGR